ncbi:hypothetical protein Godav_009821 [Gossypium davidsonii]|uniref:RNA polymerase N-terminal domain-containing protein n=1 Tax=Gossypium davidsonii TaxID=34287 RepID=A0A7J8SEB9_GOSDV|nr:hypothetical protein [Gossypium davidsonii]
MNHQYHSKETLLYELKITGATDFILQNPQTSNPYSLSSSPSGRICSPTYEVKSIRSKKKYLNINLIDLISIIPNLINRIIFFEKYETSTSYKKPFSLRLALSPSRGILVIDNKLKGFLIDDIDIDASDAIDRVAKSKIWENGSIVWEILQEVLWGHHVLLNRVLTLHRLEAQRETHLLMFSHMNLLSLVIGDLISVLTQDMLIGLYVLMSGNHLSICANKYNL